MDVVVGVAVTGRVARLAMVGAGGQVFDQYALDLPDDAMTDLAETIVGTYREVADSGNRVAATRLCLPDPSTAETLRQTVSGAGVPNVEVVAEADAAAALARRMGADAALLLADDDTVSLTTVGEDEESTSVLASLPIGAAGAAVACAAVLQQAHPEAVRIMLVGQRLDLDSIAAELRSTAPIEVPPDASYAIARGAAQTAEESGYPAGAATMMAPAAAEATMMAPAAAEATMMAPAAAEATQMAPTADPAAVGPQLAYSQEEPGEYELPFEQLEEFVPELEDEEAYTAMIAPPPPRTVLMGSALAFVVVSFATLAVTVAINVRPAAAVEAQPAPNVQSDTVPGRYLPPVPHEPDPVALPIAEVSPPPAAPAGPSVRINRGPNSVAPEAPAPAPQAPPPEPGPAPEVPVVPIPPVIPFPPFNPFPPPTFPTTPTTVTTTPTTTTTTPTTTTTTPTTTTTTPTTTTTTPTTTTTTTQTTTTTSSEAPPPVIEKTAPPVTAAPQPESPVSQAPAYVPPAAPAYTPPAVAPAPVAPVAPAPAPVIQAPSSGGGSSSGSGGSGSAPVTTIPVSP
ncbi:hypothetical protein [Mycobacterium sp. JS623]|uniref:hypothetical protein n=1 Tax=Mycobacterium sp. JS623 TaxID=212767 RepID=UPI00031DA064|nr:hypothetical protein [Mycobacterium sp. JS623]